MPFPLSDVVALISFFGLIATFFWTVKNIRRTSRQEIEERVKEMANTNHAIDMISDGVKRLETDVKEIKMDVKGIAKRQTDTEKTVAVLERDLKTAFKKIDEK